MAKKKIHIYKPEYNHDYTLIVIKSILPDYRLAYLLNDALNLQLKKEDFTLNVYNKEGNFSIFCFDAKDSNQHWALIANKQIVQKKENTDYLSLFDEVSNMFIFMPEEKKADYFLKIENNNTAIPLIKRINAIHKVITSYEINPKDLKLRDSLIF